MEKLVPFPAPASRDDAPQPRAATSDAANATTLHTFHSTHNTTAFPSGWGGATTIQQMTSFNLGGTEKLVPTTLTSFFRDILVFNLAPVPLFSLGISGPTATEDGRRSLVRRLLRTFLKLFLSSSFFTDDNEILPRRRLSVLTSLLSFSSSLPPGLVVHRCAVLSRHHPAPCWTHTEHLAFPA